MLARMLRGWDNSSNTLFVQGADSGLAGRQAIWPGVLFTAAYGVVVAVLLGRLSFWLDEIIQLVGTRSGDFSSLPYLIQSSPGTVPLGWISQILAVRWLGYSPEVARLPSALSSIGSCLCLLVVARYMKARIAWLPTVLFALLPLQFRYALEGRPYAMTVWLSLLSTWLFLRLVRRGRAVDGLLYILTLTAGLYAQPFSIFVAAAHWIWLATSKVAGRARLMALVGVSTVTSLLAFMPWYFYVRSTWRQTITTNHFAFHLSWKIPLMIVREISGASYWGSGLLILLAAIALRRKRPTGQWSRLLLLLVIVPICGALAADAVFGYFLAIRQMILVLPALALLAAEGLIALHDRSKMLGRLVGALLIGILVRYDYQWLRQPREDWEAAAQALVEQSRAPGSCLMVVPLESLGFYTFFRSSLGQSICQGSGRQSASTIILAISPYRTSGGDEQAQSVVSGRRRVRQVNVGGTLIEQYR